MKKINSLYILSNGRVAAINKKDGAIIWEIKLKEYTGTGMSHAIGQISVEDDKIYVGISGILLCLAAKDGALVWKNDLKGWGYSFISMSNVNNDAGMAALSAASAATIAATASSSAATS
jgi:outer membrane protein assembly factor BamB